MLEFPGFRTGTHATGRPAGTIIEKAQLRDGWSRDSTDLSAYRHHAGSGYAGRSQQALRPATRNHMLMDLGKGKAAARSVDPYFLRKRWNYFVGHCWT